MTHNAGCRLICSLSLIAYCSDRYTGGWLFATHTDLQSCTVTVQSSDVSYLFVKNIIFALYKVEDKLIWNEIMFCVGYLRVQASDGKEIGL